MVKLIARGHRWHSKLFDGTHASIEDLANSENISPSFVSHTQRLGLPITGACRVHPGRESPCAPQNERPDRAVPLGWSGRQKISLLKNPCIPLAQKGKYSGRPLLKLRSLLLFDLPKSQNFSVSDFIGLTVK